ncbi:kelch repeat and BTB domain-containing protein 2-like [Topomyia yanbarensis]|uniref:kelch repeat and BTB domain-containing protein 2-like n=1 Tax=Topomyia yanbarensis TaxID=2498891 RepID=UPI00273CCA7D|nr:kelch repeat and BTB domain-containing protein 2-like [Topomyia yanbarensis]
MSENRIASEQTQYWDRIDFEEKPNHLELIEKRLNEFKHTDIRIRIGETLFDCHTLLLQCFSEVFDELGNIPEVELPEEKVTQEAFQLIYDWLLSQKPVVQREHFVEVFVAAEYLRIPALINQCWTCVDDTEALMEDRAFRLYTEAIPFQHTVLQNMMLRRICKFFLTLVASDEFLHLPIEDLTILLNSNYIGVFSEADVLYAAAVWLIGEWESRSKYVSVVMKLVRFPLMSQSLLSNLIKCEEDERIHGILQHDATKNLAIQALTDLCQLTSEPRSGSSSLGFHIVRKPVQRIWLRDPTVLMQGDEPIGRRSQRQECTFGEFMKRSDHLVSNPDSWLSWEIIELDDDCKVPSSNVAFHEGNSNTE